MRTLFQVDLLIATCGLASAGHVRDAANVLPCVGNNPYTESGAECSTEMQLYSGLKDDMIVLQQRAPPMLGRYALQCLMPQFACLLWALVYPCHEDFRFTQGVHACRQEQAAEALASFLQQQGVEKVGNPKALQNDIASMLYDDRLHALQCRYKSWVTGRLVLYATAHLPSRWWC